MSAIVSDEQAPCVGQVDSVDKHLIIDFAPFGLKARIGVFMSGFSV